MSNFKHYVNSISSGNEYFTLERKMRWIIYALAIFHFALSILFLVVDVIPLMLYSIVSVVFFLTLIQRLIKKGSYGSAFFVTLGEVIVFAFFATLCTGMETGFAFYDIVLISTCFYFTFTIESFQKKEFIPFILSVLVLLCYLFNYIMMMFVPPVYPLKSQAIIHGIYLANAISAFLMIIFFSFLLVWEIKLSNRKLAVQNEMLDELAHKDPLTHLYNRRSMGKYLDQSLDALKIKGKRFSLILGDIDDFKKVNDTYGHDAGDIVLVTVADIISKNVREGDYVCRWGGEEILILINDPVETATTIAERIRKQLEETLITHDSQDIRITMTFGISESIPGYRIEHLIQQADDKLYEGKKSGKNRVIV